MSDMGDVSYSDIKSLIYRKQPPLLGVDTRTPTFSMKRQNSNSSSDQSELLLPKKSKIDAFDRDMTYIGSPREFRRMRSDLLDSRNTIRTLESHIQEMHNVRKEMEILYEKECTNLRTQSSRDRKQIDDLENQLQTIRKREINLKNELAELQNKHDKLKIQYDMQIEELEKTTDELKHQVKNDDEDKISEIANCQRKIDELQSLYEHALDECTAHKNLANELAKKAAKENALERKIELHEQTIQKQNLRVKELEYELQNYHEYQHQAKAQLHKLSKYTDLERENKNLKEETNKLKEEVHNKLLLEEEVHDLKSRLITFKEREQQLVNLQTAQLQAEMQLEEWRSLARNLCEKTGSDTILLRTLKCMVEQLQQQEINLTSEKVRLESQVSSIIHEAKVAKMELEKTKNLHKELQNTEKQRQNMMHRMQKKLSLVTRERDSYRLQLDSYEKDLTICFNQASSGSASYSQQQSQRERIEALERIVEDYKDLVAKLESDLQNVEPISSGDSMVIRTEQMNRMKDEIDKLKSDNDLLRSRKDQLEVQLEHYVTGEDITSERVVHNVKNPIFEYLTKEENEKKKLQADVERLKRKIRHLEEGIESSKLNMSISPEEIKQLKEMNKATELQMQKLKEYFKSSMQEFRNVVYMLLGYKIDKNNSQYKLTSMYAETENDTLHFQLNSEGFLDLLENQFSTSLEELIELHLRHQKSIPVFLSALTINTFNSSTMTTHIGQSLSQK